MIVQLPHLQFITLRMPGPGPPTVGDRRCCRRCYRCRRPAYHDAGLPVYTRVQLLLPAGHLLELPSCRCERETSAPLSRCPSLRPSTAPSTTGTPAESLTGEASSKQGCSHKQGTRDAMLLKEAVAAIPVALTERNQAVGGGVPSLPGARHGSRARPPLGWLLSQVDAAESLNRETCTLQLHIVLCRLRARCPSTAALPQPPSGLPQLVSAGRNATQKHAGHTGHALQGTPYRARLT